MGIGKRIKEARLNKGYSQKRLADIIGVSKGAIGNYENETSHPKEDILYRLINALEVDANFLFQDVVISQNKKAPQERGALHEYVTDKLGREPTLEELRRLDDFARMYIKGLNK